MNSSSNTKKKLKKKHNKKSTSTSNGEATLSSSLGCTKGNENKSNKKSANADLNSPRKIQINQQKNPTLYANLKEQATKAGLKNNEPVTEATKMKEWFASLSPLQRRSVLCIVDPELTYILVCK
jgi:hypothetical protein